MTSGSPTPAMFVVAIVRPSTRKSVRVHAITPWPSWLTATSGADAAGPGSDSVCGGRARLPDGSVRAWTRQSLPSQPSR